MALLSCLLDLTSNLEGEPEKSSHQNKALKLVVTYRLLLFFPVEYLRKSCRADLVETAIQADRIISQRVEDATETEASLSTLRTFLKRTFGFLGSIEEQSVSGTSCKLVLALIKTAIDVRSCRVYSAPP